MEKRQSRTKKLTNLWKSLHFRTRFFAYISAVFRCNWNLISDSESAFPGHSDRVFFLFIGAIWKKLVFLDFSGFSLISQPFLVVTEIWLQIPTRGVILVQKKCFSRFLEQFEIFMLAETWYRAEKFQIAPGSGKNTFSAWNRPPECESEVRFQFRRKKVHGKTPESKTLVSVCSRF